MVTHYRTLLGYAVFVLGVIVVPWGSGPCPWAEAVRSRRGRGHRTDAPPTVEMSEEPCPQRDNQSLLNSFLWVLKREPPSFFFGTIHVPYSRVWSHIPENTKDAFYRADQVYFELDLTDSYTISALANCQLLPRGERLSNIIPRPLFQRLEQHLDYVRLMMPSWVTSDQRGRGFYADYLFKAITRNWDRKRPVWVMLMVNTLTESEIRSRGTPVLDLYLAQEAQRLQKRTGAVEEVDEQCSPLNRLNFSQVLFALNQTLWQHENVRHNSNSEAASPPPLLPSAPPASYTASSLIRHYNCGDLDSVLFSHDTAQVPNLLNTSLSSPSDVETARQIDAYFRQELIYRRNQRMAERIDALLRAHPDKSFFFAFGAGHFFGNDTVLDALSAEGHEIHHAAPEEQLQFGERYWRRRKKLPPLLADLVASDQTSSSPSSGGNLEDYLDPFHDRRGRGRHRHGNGGRRRSRTRAKESSHTDSDHLKYPQFNDLWVRLEASSFGPNNVFGITAQPPRPPSPVYAMYNTATYRAAPTSLAVVVLAVWTSSRSALNVLGLLYTYIVDLLL